MYKQIIPTFEVSNEYVNEIIKQERVESCNASCGGCGGGDSCG